MNAIRSANPSNLRLYGNGQRVNLPKFFELLKGDGKTGVNVISNKFFDPMIMKDFNSLPADIKKELINNWLRTSTLVVKNKNGKKLGDQIVFSDGGCSVTININRALRGELGLIADLLPDNFNLELSKDGKHAVISELKETDAKVVEFVGYHQLGDTNESTMWVPVKKVLDGKPSEKRRSWIPDSEVVGLAGRLDYFLGLVRRDVYVVRPSGGSGVPEFVIGNNLELQAKVDGLLGKMDAERGNPGNLLQLSKELTVLLQKQ